MKAKICLAVVLLGAAGFGVAWATGQFSDPEFEEAEQMQIEVQRTVKKAFEAEEFKPGEHRVQMEQLRDKVEKLPEPQKDELRGQMRKFFMSQMETRIDEVLSLPPEDRTAALDKHIDQMEERRAVWEKFRSEREQSKPPASGDAAGNTGGDNSSSGAGAKDVGQSGKQTAGRTADTKGGRGSGPPGRDGSPEQRERFQREMLDNTTPEQRAKFHEYRRLIDERRSERGLPEMRRRF